MLVSSALADIILVPIGRQGDPAPVVFGPVFLARMVHRAKPGRESGMKVRVEMDMTPEEARAFMGLPDIAPLQQQMLEEMRERMRAAFDAGDPEAMMKAR